MEISVVIPIRGNIDELKKCIERIRASEKKAHQIIVVDDASRADIETHIACEDISVVKLQEHGGPSRARNIGAKAATGEIILFLDADILIKPDTLQRIEGLFKDKGESAVSGVFDDACRYRSFFSDYKNLWMRYTYGDAPVRAALFFTSIAAIRKELFFKTKGFDERNKRPSTEDTAFGNMLYNKGVKPLVTPEISVIHNKEYSFFLLLKTDFIRAAGLLKMKLRKDMGNFLREKRTSVPLSFMLSIFLTIASCLLFISGRRLIPLFLFIVSYLLNCRYLLWLYKKRGFVFFLKSSLFIPIDQLAVFLGLIYGLFSYLLGRRF